MTIADELTAWRIDADTTKLIKHDLEGPELELREMFYPWGFPLEVWTNCEDVLRQCGQMWGWFEKQHNTEPMHANIQVVEGAANECPPEPGYRVMSNLLYAIADQDNYCVVDMEKSWTQVVIARATLRHSLYAQYFLLGMAGSCVATHYVTPIHAGCVEWDGKGVLLCGESGAGKSTLSYACARAGWKYVSDDATFLLHEDGVRKVTGNWNQIRFRPSAAELFPELQGLEITPRAAGKPSIELPTAPIANMRCAETTNVEFIVYLHRDWSGAAEIVSYSVEAARTSMQKVLCAPRQRRLVQYSRIERLLTVPVLELRYSNLNEAIERLRILVQDGR